MTNMRRAKTPARKQASLTREQLRESVFLLADLMEEPLRRAGQMVFVLAMLDTSDGEEMEAITLVAMEAKDRLDFVHATLLRLFKLASG